MGVGGKKEGEKSGLERGFRNQKGGRGADGNEAADVLIALKKLLGGPTCNSQVGVCLDLSGQIAGEALEHARVVRQEAVDLQAAPDQHPVPGDLDRTDGRRVFVPHDIWLRCAWTRRRGLLFSPRRHCRTEKTTQIKKNLCFGEKKANESNHLVPGRGCRPPFPFLR